MILAGIVRYSIFVFIVSSLVVSIISGLSDVIYHSRCVAAQEEWFLEAESEGEEFIEVDYTPNLVTGIAAFVMFAFVAILAVFFFTKRFDSYMHILLITATAAAALIAFLPRPSIGTGTAEMREVFSYLMLLGIIDSSLYRTFVLEESSSEILQTGAIND